MKPWERKLYDWGLLGYLVRDVIGAHQEESFGIRQNHTMGIRDWDALIRKYFASQEYEVFVPGRGWGETIVKSAAGSEWAAARLLGGTLAAVCKKAGEAPPAAAQTRFEDLLRCPDCHSTLVRDAREALRCIRCPYQADDEAGVYNLLPTAERRELYPGERADIIDFSVPGHERQLLDGWYDLEGIYGNKYRWIGARATARLERVKPEPSRIRIRGHASAQGIPGEVRATVNGTQVGAWKLERTGLFVLEADVPEAEEYTVEIDASPTFTVPTDDRTFSVNLSMIRLIGRD
jgi:hypothetical protein